MNRELRTTNLEPQSPNFSALCHIRLKIRANPRKPRLIFSELPTPNSLCLRYELKNEKQTQFQKGKNEHKLSYNKGL